MELQAGTTVRLLDWARTEVGRGARHAPPGTVVDPVLGRRVAQGKQDIDPAYDGSADGPFGGSGMRNRGASRRAEPYRRGVGVGLGIARRFR